MPAVFTRDIQRALLEDTRNPLQLRLRGSHPLWRALPERFASLNLGLNGASDTTSPHTHRVRIQFALSGFRSPLLAGSQLLSLPAGTKMLQFPAFPIPKGTN